MKIIFENDLADFGTFATVFDSKVGQILKRTINLVTNKLHKDYLSNYQDTLNKKHRY